MPRIGADGLLVGVLVEENSIKRYTLEAKLTTFVPGLFDPSHRVAFGGVYGTLRSVAAGGSLGDAEPELIGRVEGLWRMEKDLTGEYEVFVHRRLGSAGAELAGAIRGVFRVAIVDDALPAPQQPDYGSSLPSNDPKPAKSGTWSDARSGKQTKSRGLSDARSAGASVIELGDAVSAHRWSDAGSDRDELGDARSAASKKPAPVDDARSSASKKNPKPAKGALSDAHRAAKKGAGGGYGTAGGGFGTAADGAVVHTPLMLGEFRARMKLLD